MAIAAKKKPKPAKTRPGRSSAPSPRKSAGGKPRSANRHPTTATAERSAPPMAEIDADALEFIEAIDRFKREHGRPFPSWSEVLMVLRELGYRRA